MANYEKVRKGLLLALLPKASPTGLPERRIENVAVDHMASLNDAAKTTDLNSLTIHESPIKIRPHSKRVQAAELAQLVEHATENRSVRGPIPRLGTKLKRW